jgi:hypothetical protein
MREIWYTDIAVKHKINELIWFLNVVTIEIQQDDFLKRRLIRQKNTGFINDLVLDKNRLPIITKIKYKKLLGHENESRN